MLRAVVAVLAVSFLYVRVSMSRGSQFTFSQVPSADIPRSTFNRTHNYKTTFNSGILIPFYVDEALPGDTFNLRVNAFARLSTPIVPIMDNMYMDMFFFAVPNRLVWDNWQKFMGEQDNPGDSIDYTVPVLTVPIPGFTPNSIYDYMGLPVLSGFGGLPAPSALPLRAYNLIYNQWFRDQNLQPSVAVPKGDGPDTHQTYSLLRRGKRHDYFTSCLPWPQKGPGVEIPIGGVVPIEAGVSSPTWRQSGETINHRLRGTAGGAAVTLSPNAIDSSDLTWWSTGLTVQGGTINDLRQAFQIQRLLERDARGGTRYVEILKSHFRVDSPDARLQRPEYLGGGSVPVVIHSVAQTSGSPTTPSTIEETPQANLSAIGLVSSHGNGFTKSFVEHSIIIGLVMVRADLSYQGGVNRMWVRRTRYDFYWPALAHLGEQPVYQYELDVASASGAVFGYQERWAEYRYHPSLITGQFRSNVPGSLDYWHLAQALTNPVLNAAFIEENPPVDRVVAVPDEPEWLFDSHFMVKCARPMPLYSVPGMADHF
ncbi:MAG: major capsid protein [Microvirus sp.]|nr:MAG: major capsid protein [Microvirus sp.]